MGTEQGFFALKARISTKLGFNSNHYLDGIPSITNLFHEKRLKIDAF